MFVPFAKIFAPLPNSVELVTVIVGNVVQLEPELINLISGMYFARVEVNMTPKKTVNAKNNFQSKGDVF